MDEEMEKSADNSNKSPNSDKGGKLFEPGIFVAY